MDEIVQRVPAPMVRIRELRERFRRDDQRLRLAVQHLRAVVRDATPAARIRRDPYRWVAGGFVAGLALGLLWPASRRWV